MCRLESKSTAFFDLNQLMRCLIAVFQLFSNMIESTITIFDTLSLQINLDLEFVKLLVINS